MSNGEVQNSRRRIRPRPTRISGTLPCQPQRPGECPALIRDRGPPRWPRRLLFVLPKRSDINSRERLRPWEKRPEKGGLSNLVERELSMNSAAPATSLKVRLRSYVVIPARLESTRLPRKLLLRQTGRPLIQHTYESAQRASKPLGVLVAADHAEMAEAVTALAAAGGEAAAAADQSQSAWGRRRSGSARTRPLRMC